MAHKPDNIPCYRLEPSDDLQDKLGMSRIPSQVPQRKPEPGGATQEEEPVAAGVEIARLA